MVIKISRKNVIIEEKLKWEKIMKNNGMKFSFITSRSFLKDTSKRRSVNEVYWAQEVG